MNNIKVKVVYALCDKQYIHSITLITGSTVEDAINSSGLLLECKEIDLTSNKIGIFSKPVKLSDILQNGDRVEIYRPLINSPKELRRKRAENAIKNKKK